MKFFIIDKVDGSIEIRDRESKNDVTKLLLESELDPSEFEIYTPQEYQEHEIEAARKKQIEADNPLLSKYFPRTADEIARKSEKPFITKSGSDDMLSLGGRSIGAIADGVMGDNSFYEDYMQSLGEAKSNDRERSTLGDIAQGVIRDPLLIPGAAIPVKIPGLGNLGNAIKNKAASVLLNNVAKPAVEGAAGGAAMGLARPVVTTDDMQLDRDIVMGAATNTVLQGAAKLLGRGLSQAEFDKLLLRLANKNNVKPEFLNAAATPEGRAKMPQNYKTQAQIAEDLIDYKHFDEGKFPENKTVQEFLDRSQTKVKPEAAVKNLTEYEKRVLEEAGGGGLTTIEEATQRRLPKEAEIFYEQKPKAPAPESVFEVKTEKPVLFNAEGQQIARSKNPPRKVREMTAKELNNARQRIGQLLEDDFKREQMGRPDGEVKALKDAYFNLRNQLMNIAETEGETAAVEAYRAMAGKLGAREALFDALRVPENKNTAQDRLAKNLENIEGNNRKTKLLEQLKEFDKAFGTDFSERVKWMNIANNLGESVDGQTFKQLRGDNNFFTGKGIRKPLTDNLTGRTIASAVKKLENARPGTIKSINPNPAIAGGVGQANAL